MKAGVEIRRQGPLKLVASLPGDKSISHRAVIVGALSKGVSRVRNLLESEDCLHTIGIFKAMGVSVRRSADGEYRIAGAGLHGLKAPRTRLDCGNSGTTMRLMSGLLAAQDFDSVLTGDASLKARPMDRVIAPLARMGARIRGKGPRQTAPLEITGGRGLKGIRYTLPVASAQVKSAILLAGLYAQGDTAVVEKEPTRNHTEIFLRNTGVDIHKKGKGVLLGKRREPGPFSIEVPGDISSAAFLLAAGALVPGSDIRLKSVLWNPTRTGIIRVLKRMGARLEVSAIHDRSIEWTADLRVRPGPLAAAQVLRKEIPSLVDELPVLMVLMTQAKGESRILGAAELRVKETDRIRSMTGQLEKMGARIRVRNDDIYIEGPTPLTGCGIESYGDHRTAMSFIVAGMIAGGTTRVRDIANIDTSFPNFFKLLKKAGCRFQLTGLRVGGLSGR